MTDTRVRSLGKIHLLFRTACLATLALFRVTPLFARVPGLCFILTPPEGPGSGRWPPLYPGPASSPGGQDNQHGIGRLNLKQ